ncbi:deubiquitinating enzyme [Datura stramonium]|uniref:ubiquitinyl hydrolase 1 n=1 Tax=Datura stramonium TaxID=4076 RepID=A0ABS8T188_DATST|nr:deubiquitinating enzyme [Datura stramonium]
MVWPGRPNHDIEGWDLSRKADSCNYENHNASTPFPFILKKFSIDPLLIRLASERFFQSGNRPCPGLSLKSGAMRTPLKLYPQAAHTDIYRAQTVSKVDYPLSLDVYDLCSDSLRKKLEVPRQVLRDEEGKKAGLKTSAKTSVSTDSDTKMTEAEESSSGSGEASKSTSQEGVLPEKEHQLTGIYDLVAVLTHKGRSADSGHYVAWVKQENGKWVQFDDDNPIPQREEDITKLSGGGDWHMAYICMYKARVVPM